LKAFIQKLGPGFLFAGAAIGVSHLVQSTKAGGYFGFGLLWALLLINIVKYPFFQFGPRYASATGESLLKGYAKMGKGVVLIYFIITLATMFTIQTAVTIVTAGIAQSLFGFGSIQIWTIVVLLFCFSILMIGKYKTLDTLMKVIILTLTLSTLITVAIAMKKSSGVTFTQIIPSNTISIGFLIAFMGWMPAPLDISIWHSIWTVEKSKATPSLTSKESLFDFNVGYLSTIFLAIGFMSLGALVMFGSNTVFSEKGGVFANQLISMYTNNLGDWSKIIITIAALTTMLSTCLTTLDGSPRVMHQTSQILTERLLKKGYFAWICILITGTLLIFFLFSSEMRFLIKIATVLSFLTAPFYAIINFKLVFSKYMPIEFRPSKLMKIYSFTAILILIAFCIWYLSTLL